MFNGMDEPSRDVVRTILNDWWESEKIEPEALKARVVHLYKKGNTSDFANYRPISLLNTLYKIFTSILRDRIAQGIDASMHSTQYGFRRARSTQQAIHIIRRVLEYLSLIHI